MLLDASNGRCLDVDDPEIFFSGNPEAVRQAKALCAECPVRVACLTAALRERDLDGIWGGTTPAERKNRVSTQAILMNKRARKPVSYSERQREAIAQANEKRKLAAGEAASARAVKLLIRLAGKLPSEVKQTLELRANNPTLSLAEIAELHQPAVTRDVVAGRIRRAEQFERPQRKRSGRPKKTEETT